MSDLQIRRRLNRVTTERDQALQDNRHLRNQILALRQTSGEIPVEYAAALALLRDVAYGGWRRPDDLGGPVTGGEPASRRPTYSEPAYNRLREERRWLARQMQARAARIVDTVARLVDGETVAEQAPGAA